MKLLIIGGTRFLGRALATAALDSGWELTLFNRGRSNPDLFPDAEKLIGDRDGGLAALKGRRWDAVIDTCGYVPRLVGDAARLLADAVDLYTFISTISVYADPPPSGLNESSPLATLADASTEEVNGETYGGLKVLCEQAASAAMDGRALHVRCGLIVGPHDMTDRWTYWPLRVAEGGEMLAPGDPAAPLQYIDVRDLAEWTLRATAARLSGPYNATGPAEPRAIQAMLAEMRAVTGADTRFTWVDESFLLEQGIQPWMTLPLWLPAELGGLHRASIAKALAAGLTFRPLAATVRETLSWNAERPAERSRDHDLSLPRIREAEILAAWHARNG